MTSTNQLEQNTIESFKLVKQDVLKLSEGVIGISSAVGRLSEIQAKMIEEIEKLKRENLIMKADLLVVESKIKDKSKISERKSHSKKKKTKVAKKKTGRKKLTKRKFKKSVKVHTKKFISAKGSKKFHIRSCPFAKNILPKDKVLFKSKTGALNKGLKPCKCVQK